MSKNYQYLPIENIALPCYNNDRIISTQQEREKGAQEQCNNDYLPDINRIAARICNLSDYQLRCLVKLVMPQQCQESSEIVQAPQHPTAKHARQLESE